MNFRRFSYIGLLWLIVGSFSLTPVSAANRDGGWVAQLAQSTSQGANWAATEDQVRQAQQQLSALGFDPGGADGKLGPRTVAAIRKYQQSQSLAPDGKLTEELFQRLTVKPEPDAATAPPPPTETDSDKPEATKISCPPAVGRWQFADQQGSVFELTLEAGGNVAGISYPRHWHWNAKEKFVEIAYDNGMGLTVSRRGLLKEDNTMVGDAADSRGRTWTWTAKRMAASAGAEAEDCPAVPAS